jgi:predicted amino acid-binding ACT domain protein
MEGEVVLARQNDQPGIIAAVSSLLAQQEINISYMSVSRDPKSKLAIMAIGVDSAPSAEVCGGGGGGRGSQ